MMEISASPSSLNFGGVPPGSAGPDISVDPSLPPTAISFAGGVKIAEVPADDTVTARIAGNDGPYQVRDLSALEWVLEDADPNELPPGHHGRPPKVRVLEVVAQVRGAAPLAVKKGQMVLARVAYNAPVGDGVFNGTLTLGGSVWEITPVHLSLFLSAVVTEFGATPAILPRGTRVNVPITVRTLSGQDMDVTYQRSPTQLESGIDVLSLPPVRSSRTGTPAILPLLVALDAPIGDNTIAINQFAA